MAGLYNALVYLKTTVALAALTVFLTVLFVSKGKQRELAGEINEYGFILPFLAPLGLYIGGKRAFTWGSSYEGKIRGKIMELFGQRRARAFFEIHNAQRASLAAFVLTVFCVILALGDADPTAYLFAVAVTGLSGYWADRQLDKKIQNRKRSILIDLPVFVNTLALLINAGLTYAGAVQKAVRNGKLARPLYKEFGVLLADISTGKPVNQAYEELTVRCRVPEITRFVSVILQNINRGNSDLVYVLRNLAQEAWEKRKDIAKKQGEEAAAKLVFPMVMVFLAVAIMVLAPAVITMSK